MENVSLKVVRISTSLFPSRIEVKASVIRRKESTHFIFGRSMVSFLLFEPVLVCLHVARARRLVTFL